MKKPMTISYKVNSSRRPRLRQPPKEYMYFLVDETGKVHGGNEYRSDAVEASRDLPSLYGKIRVVHRRTAKAEGIDLRGYW